MSSKKATTAEADFVSFVNNIADGMVVGLSVINSIDAQCKDDCLNTLADLGFTGSVSYRGEKTLRYPQKHFFFISFTKVHKDIMNICLTLFLYFFQNKVTFRLSSLFETEIYVK